MKDNFAYSLATTLVYEGGYSNHPKDPGGATMKGVTQATYNAYRKRKGLAVQGVRSLTDAELKDIYKSGYWDTVNGDTLASGVDLVVFDYAVNSGPGRAQKDLFASVGGSAADTVKRLCARRLSFLKALKTWSTFGKGWSSRVHSVEAKGLALTAGSPSKATALLLSEAKASDKKVTAASGALTAPVATVGGATPAVVGAKLSVAAWVAIGGLGLACVAAGAFIVWRMVVNSRRAKAMREVALGL